MEREPATAFASSSGAGRAASGTAEDAVATVLDREAPGSNPGPPTTFPRSGGLAPGPFSDSGTVRIGHGSVTGCRLAGEPRRQPLHRGHPHPRGHVAVCLVDHLDGVP